MKKLIICLFFLSISLIFCVFNTPHQLINSKDKYPIIYTFVFSNDLRIFIGYNNSYVALNYIEGNQIFVHDFPFYFDDSIEKIKKNETTTIFGSYIGGSRFIDNNHSHVSQLRYKGNYIDIYISNHFYIGII